MTIDSLIAIGGLILAVFALLPRHRQMELGLGFRPLDALVLSAIILAVHYYLYLGIRDPKGEYSLPNWPTGLPAGTIAYIVLLAGGLVLILRLYFFRLTPRRMPRFRDLVEELRWSEIHPLLFEVVDRHLDALERIALGNYWLPRLRQHLSSARPPSPAVMAQILEMLKEPQREQSLRRASYASRVRSAIRERALNFLPDTTSRSTSAHEVIRLVLTAPDLVNSIADNRPYFALRLLRLQVYEVHEFTMLYFSRLLDRPGSIWYFELRRNVNVGVGSRYALPETNRLLHFLLADAHVAEKLSVYKPVGDYILQELDRLVRAGDQDTYNWATGDFHEEGRWSSPLYMGLFFFDVMVSSALWQGIRWHMWLYYFPPITERILRNYATVDVLVDLDHEWPTRYSYLLYVIMSTLRSWIEAVEHLPPEQPNVRLAAVDAQHENGNIPKSSIIALGQCTRMIALCPRLPESFRNYLLAIPLRLFLKLRATTAAAPFATVLGLVLSNGGSWPPFHDEPEYREALETAFALLDKVPFNTEHLAELERHIAQAR